MGFTRDKILTKTQFKNTKVAPVKIPEWADADADADDDSLFVRRLTLGERDEVEDYVGRNNATSPSKNSMKGVRSLMLVKAISDEKGNRLFEDEEEQMILGWDPIIVDRIFEEAQSLSFPRRSNLKKN